MLEYFDPHEALTIAVGIVSGVVVLTFLRVLARGMLTMLQKWVW